MLPCTNAIPGISLQTYGYHFCLTERENLLISVSCCLCVQCITQKWGEGAPLNQALTHLGEGPGPGDLWLGNGTAAMKGAETYPVRAQHPFLLEAMKGPVPSLFFTFWKPLGTISPEVSIHCTSAANIEMEIFLPSWSIMIAISQAENQFVWMPSEQGLLCFGLLWEKQKGFGSARKDPEPQTLCSDRSVGSLPHRISLTDPTKTNSSAMCLC